MTPKEKAVELIYKYWNTKVETIHVKESIISKELAIKCALIAVDEILNEVPSKRYWDTYGDETPSAITYWQEVKQEILKL
jgi:hypothetical protein